MPYLNSFANRRKDSCTRRFTGLAVSPFLLVIAAFLTETATSTLTLAASNSAAFVQAAASAVLQGSPHSLSLAFPSNTLAGDLILVAFDFAPNAATPSLSDTQGNVFTQVGKQLSPPGGGTFSQVYYAKNIKGGADTVTVTLSADVSVIELYLTEYSGINPTNPIDAEAGTSGSTAAVSSGTATTTVAGDMIYGYCWSQWICTAGSGFTARSTLDSNVIEDKVAGSAGSYAATGTDTSSGSANTGWTMQMVALKPASVGGEDPAPDASLSTPSLTFASQTVGSTSAAQSVTLSNTGDAALSITSIGITGTNPSAFGQTNNCESSVAVGASCTINVTFTPAAAGSLSAALTLTDNASGSPQSVTLTGTGTSNSGTGGSGTSSPVAGVSPSSLAFGSEPMAMTSAAQTVTLSNTGSAALSITSIAVTGANAGDFTEVADTCGISLGAGGSCTISIAFTPSVTSAESASLTITDNASGSPQTVGLSGTGAHDVILSWTASATSGIVGYYVFRGTTSGGESSTPLNSTPTNGTTYTDTNVTPGATYYYVVTAVCSSGEQSAASGETAATVP